MIRIQRVEWKSEAYLSSLYLRDEVLRKPLKMNLFNEDLSDEENQYHFVALENDIAQGVVVLSPTRDPKIGKLRQMATSESIRGTGFGTALVDQLEDFARSIGIEEIQLHARHYAVAFYQKLEYEICSAAFEEVGIQHFKMRKIITE